MSFSGFWHTFFLFCINVFFLFPVFHHFFGAFLSFRHKYNAPSIKLFRSSHNVNTYIQFNIQSCFHNFDQSWIKFTLNLLWRFCFRVYFLYFLCFCSINTNILRPTMQKTRTINPVLSIDLSINDTCRCSITCLSELNNVWHQGQNIILSAVSLIITTGGY